MVLVSNLKRVGLSKHRSFWNYKFANAKVSKREKNKANSWLPRYVGIHGNELVDETAKAFPVPDVL